MKRKKLNKTEKKKISRMIYVFLTTFILLLSLYTLCYGLFIYGRGHHNVDLGHNIRIVNAENNLSYIDITNKFNEWTPTTMYITGFNQIDAALYLCILGAMGFGFFFSFFQVRQGG